MITIFCVVAIFVGQLERPETTYYLNNTPYLRKYILFEVTNFIMQQIRSLLSI
jgi:hypothetical protein